MLRQSLLATIFVCLATSSSTAGNWVPLFDGHSFDAWTAQNGKPVESGWRITRGVVHLDPTQGRGGNIVTNRDYGNFELVFEWKNSQTGNSGIKYRVKSFDGRVLGCEYQMLDDEAFPSIRPKQLTASLYDVYAPQFARDLRPHGQYNRGRIVVCGNRIEHWLNGRMVVRAQVGSPEWDARIAESKFADVEGFGRNPYGRIMLTDHNSEIAFRNVFIRELDARPTYVKRGRCIRRRGFGFRRRR